MDYFYDGQIRRYLTQFMRVMSNFSYKDGSGRVYIVYKFDIGSREGLALEHIVEFLFNRKNPNINNQKIESIRGLNSAIATKNKSKFC